MLAEAELESALRPDMVSSTVLRLYPLNVFGGLLFGYNVGRVIPLIHKAILLL